MKTAADWALDSLLNLVAVTSNHDTAVDTLSGGLGTDTAFSGPGDSGDWEIRIL